jgi:hypothetical protein
LKDSPLAITLLHNIHDIHVPYSAKNYAARPVPGYSKYPDRRNFLPFADSTNHTRAQMTKQAVYGTRAPF